MIQKFFRDLPDHVPPAEIEKAEQSLAKHATELRPDQLQTVANRLALTLNPDGTFSDEDRARKRGFTWCGGQRVDGMSVGKLIATPNSEPCSTPGSPNSPNSACATPTTKPPPSPANPPKRSPSATPAACPNANTTP